MANCLICSRVVISDDDEEKSGKISQFRQGLQLFCKLLEINGNFVDKVFLIGGKGHGEDAVDSGPSPCCKECWVAFEQMLRLQQAIELMQANLMEQLDKLKAALNASVPSDYEEDPLKIPPADSLGQLREQLLSYARNSTSPSSLTSDHPPRKKRKQTLTKSPKQPDSVLAKKGKEYQSCSVILKRLPDNLLNSVLSPVNEIPADITIKQEINTSFNEPYGDIGGCGRRSPRKSKLKALDIIRENATPEKPSPSIAIIKDDRCDSNDEEYVPSPETPPSPIQSNDEDDEDEYPWESEVGPIPVTLPTPTNTTCRTGRLSKFSLISPDTLLYQYTLIKVSQGYTHFTCQEPECPSPNFSDSSLNWNNLFSQIAEHIKVEHSVVREESHRKCPLCPEIWPAGPKFRAHLVASKRRGKDDSHRIETVICELCWKPIRNLADAYRCHLWYHKNEQEKAESPEGLPPTLLSKYTRAKNKKLLREYGKFKKMKPKIRSKPQKKAKRIIGELTDMKYEPTPFPSNHDHQHEDDDQEDDSMELEAEPTPEQLTNQLNSTCGTGKMTKFSLISPDTLLYQYTLIKVSQGYTHFTCQEPQCPSPHFSDDSLNWNSVFNQIAGHIKLLHSTPSSSKDEAGRKCPLCPAILPAGSKFRSHIVASKRKKKGDTHRIETVVCEVCWRPIENQADAYRCHLWNHKNDQEKEECPEGLPSSMLSKSKMLMKKIKKNQNAGKATLEMEKHKAFVNLKYSKKAIVMDDCTPPVDDNKQQSSIKKYKGRPPQIGDHFSIIMKENSREYLFLHKSTLLKAFYGVSLTCQEFNCDHVVNGTDFTAFEEFKHHVKSCHATENADAVWKCPLCAEEFQSGESFRCHLIYKCYTVSKLKNNALPLLCTVCWKPVLSVPTLEYHQWLHKSETEKEAVLKNGERPPTILLTNKKKERQCILKCEKCDREFNAVAYLKLHLATHVPKEQRKKYMCHQCPKLFLSPVAVRAHVEREHQRELMRLRTCPICSQQFNWRDGYSFRSHLRSHKNERPFVCEICGKAFFGSVSLRNHKKTVHEEKDRRWQCEFCEMSYRENYHLKRHKRNAHQDKLGEEEMVKANEEKVIFGPKIAFPCPVCEKVFELKSRMKKHWEKSCKNK